MTLCNVLTFAKRIMLSDPHSLQKLLYAFAFAARLRALE